MCDINKVFEYIEEGNYEALKEKIDKWNKESKKSSIYSSLIKAKNIDEVLDTGEDNLNNPIFLLDTSYKILGRSRKAYKNNKSIEKCNGEEYLLIDTVKKMKKEKCIDNIYESSGAFFHKADNRDKEKFIFSPVRNNNITVAYISVLEENNFTESDLEIVNTLSEVISIEFERENIFTNTSGLQEEYYLKNLLTNEINNLDYIKEKFKEVDFELRKNFMIISIPCKQKYQDFRHNFGIKELVRVIKSILINSISTYYDENIVIMLSSNSEKLLSNEIKKQFEDFLKLNKLRCGISFIFQDLLEIKDYFKQSKYALILSRDKEIKVNYFEDYIEDYLFLVGSDFENKMKKIKLSNIIHPNIKKLKNFDNINKTELLKTLEVYFKNNRHSNDTSKKLNIHRSTFFYRYHKIEEILNVSLKSSEELFKLELSIKLLNSIN